MKDNKSEKQIISKIHTMCLESLPPDIFYKWLKVREKLLKNRFKNQNN